METSSVISWFTRLKIARPWPGVVLLRDRQFNGLMAAIEQRRLTAQRLLALPDPLLTLKEQIQVLDELREAETVSGEEYRYYAAQAEDACDNPVLDLPVMDVGPAPHDRPQAILWGDSNAAHYIGVVGAFAELSGFSFRNLAIGACPPLFSDPTAFVASRRTADCIAASAPVRDTVRRFPWFCAAWARLAKNALESGDDVAAYAFARTGYHRGLDQLRRSGWKGHGPIPWDHKPNRGFLKSLHQLSRAAAAIGEADEAARCAQFVRDCDPAAADALA